VSRRSLVWGAQAASLLVSAASRNEIVLRSTTMPDERFAIPLADVLRAANELVSARLIKDYALGGALAAIY
jgi:hypothetical protein